MMVHFPSENTQPGSADIIADLLAEARRRLDADNLRAPGGSVGTVADLTPWGLLSRLVDAVETLQAPPVAADAGWLERLSGRVRGWPAEDGGSCLVEAHDLIAMVASHGRMTAALHEGRRAIGDHWAPNDCYATGPVTGDSIRDLVECPACSFIADYDAAIAKAKGVGR
jgi:hypothetical protein